MTDYYVKNGGDNGASGLSDSEAWETIAHVNGVSFSAGDCVYFLCGGTWYTRTDAGLKITHSGIDINNLTVFGSYYMDSGVETHSVNIDGKPIIDGGWDLITFEDAGYQFGRMISPEAVDYTHIKNFHLQNTHGYGIYNGYTTPSPVGYNHISNISVADAGRAGIATFYLGTNPIVEYCKVLRDNRQFFIDESTNWDSGIRIRGNNGICRYNEVGNGWGEGIGVSPGESTSNISVYNNLVWGRQSVGIYMGCCSPDNFVYNNVVIGTTNTDYHKPYSYGGRTWNSAGIGFNQEKAGYYTLRNQVHNNVVIGCLVGIQSINKSTHVVGYDDRQLVYNNTFIDNFFNINTHTSELMDTEYKNNLSIINTDADAIGSTHVWRDPNVGPTSTYRPLGNFWSSTPEYTAWEHVDDVIGDAKLGKTSGWQSISVPSDIDIAAGFALTTGSAAIDCANDLGTVYNSPFTIGTDFNTADASDSDTPIVVVTGDQGSDWDFGAYVYGETHTPYTRARGIMKPQLRFNTIGRRFV